MNHDIDAWRDKLSAMAADEIADLCREEEIKAFPGVDDSCAIAQLIEKKTGVRVAVGLTSIIYHVDEVETLTDALQRSPWKGNGPVIFIRLFDNYAYPDITKKDVS